MNRILSVLGAVFLLAPAASAADAPKKPNVVLVMADDQGWGDMAYNGHPHLKTPNFDAMAKEAIRFDLFHAAAPVCSPTRASVMTGRTPNRMATFKWGHPIRPQETTLAQVLKAAGYRTGHFGKWHLGSVQKDGLATPGKCGFDEWVSAPNFFDLDPVLSDKGKAVEFKGDSSDVTADLAVKFMRDCAAKKQPFLTVVWFGSPHAPHKALPEDRKLYDARPAAERDFLGEITAMDRAFGRIRSEIKKLGLTDDTILWYCSDNGALPKLGSSGGRRGAKGQVYEGGLLVPALLEWPSRYPKPRVISVPCVMSDIYPTVLEWAGAKADKQPPLDGISLVPLLDGKAKARSKPIGFWDHPTGGVGTPSKEWMRQVPRPCRVARRVVETAPDREREGRQRADRRGFGGTRGGFPHQVGTVRPRHRPEGVARPARDRAEASRGDEERPHRVARIGRAQPQRRGLPSQVSDLTSCAGRRR